MAKLDEQDRFFRLFFVFFTFVVIGFFAGILIGSLS